MESFDLHLLALVEVVITGIEVSSEKGRAAEKHSYIALSLEEPYLRSLRRTTMLAFLSCEDYVRV